MKNVDYKNNIILIGMPGAGKSTVGVVLAKKLGYEFLDSDLVIQKKTGKRLQEILDDEGTEGFNRIENDINYWKRFEKKNLEIVIIIHLQI